MDRSVFQIPVPQVKVEGAWWERPMVPVWVGCVPQVLELVSAAGVLGCEAVGDMPLLAKDDFLACGMLGCEVSFNQDARRTGFCC